MASLLVQGGVAAERADGLAALVISAGQGAVALVRAERDMAALDLIEGELVGMVGQVS